MVRTYKRKNLRGQWSEDNLKIALHQIKSKIKSVSQASEEYKIPKSTLRDHLKNRCRNAAKTKVIPKTVGRRTVFTIDQENELEDYCLKLSRRYYGLTVTEFRELAYQFAEKLGVQSRFRNKQNKKIAGWDFYLNFMKRHPALSLRSPEATSLNRVIGFNKTEIERFFTNLSVLYEKHNYSPGDIYNVDESGLHTVHKPSKIIAGKGVKQVGKITSAERGDLVTIICCFSAAGNYIPPFLLFPRKLMNDRLMKNAPPGSQGFATENGWSNTEIFTSWMKHFINCVRPSKEKHVCLILDNHQSHISLEVYDLAKENGVDMLSLPPHTSHRTQPLDLVFFGPLKSAFNNECSFWMKTNVGKRISIYEIAELFGRAYQKVATVDKAVNGFKTAGIYPYQPNVFSDEDFVAAHAINPSLANHSETSNNDQSGTPVFDIARQNNTTPPPPPSTSLTTLDADTSSTSLVNMFPLSAPSCSEVPKKKRNMKRQHSDILTSTPLREELEKKHLNAIQKKRNENEGTTS